MTLALIHVERSHAFPLLSPSPRGDAGREQVWCQLYLKRTIETPGVSTLRNDCPPRSPVSRHTGHRRVGTEVRVHKLCTDFKIGIPKAQTLYFKIGVSKFNS